MAPTAFPVAQNLAMNACSSADPRYCRIPGAWPPGSSSPSYAATSSSRHDTGDVNASARLISS